MRAILWLAPGLLSCTFLVNRFTPCDDKDPRRGEERCINGEAPIPEVGRVLQIRAADIDNDADEDFVILTEEAPGTPPAIKALTRDGETFTLSEPLNTGAVGDILAFEVASLQNAQLLDLVVLTETQLIVVPDSFGAIPVPVVLVFAEEVPPIVGAPKAMNFGQLDPTSAGLEIAVAFSDQGGARVNVFRTNANPMASIFATNNLEGLTPIALGIHNANAPNSALDEFIVAGEQDGNAAIVPFINPTDIGLQSDGAGERILLDHPFAGFVNAQLDSSTPQELILGNPDTNELTIIFLQQNANNLLEVFQEASVPLNEETPQLFTVIDFDNDSDNDIVVVSENQQLVFLRREAANDFSFFARLALPSDSSSSPIGLPIEADKPNRIFVPVADQILTFQLAQ